MTRPEEEERSTIAYLSLGSNVGDRESFLRRALHQLADHPEIRIEKVSSLYETDPVGYTEQPPFLNAVAKIKTTLPPDALLRLCQSIEQSLCRERKIRWGPRTIDIDILTYDQLSVQLPDLILPHPRMQDRDFVLIPLREITENSCETTPTVRLFRKNWFDAHDDSTK